jgi:hypothetical protein
MFLRKSLLLENGKSGMVFNTGLVSWARFLVLIIAMVFFFFSLSSEYAYNSYYRATVIVLAVFICFVVGPRTEVLIIQSERRLKIEKRFLIFSRAKEYDLSGNEVLETRGKKIFIGIGDTLHCIAESGNANEREAWQAEIRNCLERMREVERIM